jgi:hypothetical protein
MRSADRHPEMPGWEHAHPTGSCAITQNGGGSLVSTAASGLVR